jgi:hypothetical protein
MSERCEPPLDDSTDDAPAETVMAALVCCFLSWEPDARVLGNVRSADAVRAIREMWGKANTPVTPPATVAALVEALEELTGPYTGGADHALDDPYIVERARAALTLYREAGR